MINLMDSFWLKPGLLCAVRNPGLKSGVIYVCNLVILIIVMNQLFQHLKIRFSLNPN